MFILKGIDQLTNAIAKAKKVRPRVEFDRFGRYRVSGSKGYYTVICRKDERGIKTVACTCRGAELQMNKVKLLIRFLVTLRLKSLNRVEFGF